MYEIPFQAMQYNYYICHRLSLHDDTEASSVTDQGYSRQTRYIKKKKICRQIQQSNKKLTTGATDMKHYN